MISAGFPSLLQSFFTDRLLRQRQASPHTIAGYRDCFRLLLQFAKTTTRQNALPDPDRRPRCSLY
jgi:site-specific recombinase XerC